MKYVFITLGVLVALVVLAFLALIVNVRVAMNRQRKLLQQRLAPVIDPIRAGSPPDKQAIAAFAANAELRNDLFDALEKIGHAEAFPAQYRTPESFAESVLVRWLAHPNELQKAPDEIQFVSKHLVESKTGQDKVLYFLFRFRVQPPHFAADRGWMAGVCGPFSSVPNASLIKPVATFSELESFDKKPPDEHVRSVHETVGGA